MEPVLHLGGLSPTILGSFSTHKHHIAYNWSHQSHNLHTNDRISSLFFEKCHQRKHKLHCGKKSRTSIVACFHPVRDTRRNKKCLTHPQNTDLPPVLPKQKKKPFPIPLKKILETSRADKKLAEKGIEKLLEPPKNGLLVPDLVPVAYEVVDAWKILIKGLSQLLHVIPVHACSECGEVHVGPTGHEIQTCHGPNSANRRSFHLWVKGSITDILLPIESYHQFDPYGTRIKHETRFDYDRIPAVVELCIQAGVELPEYPSRRRTQPIRMLGKKVIDRGGTIEPPKMPPHSEVLELDTHRALERFSCPAESDVVGIAHSTLNAYEKVRWGVGKLMRKYSVKACGYCSEVHVGPWGHNAKLCGEFKHQWRDGKHGWQDATVDEVFPPNYVWHVRDLKGPPLKSLLKRFYGKAPVVVEMCVQAGAVVPRKYRPMMRLDIVVPDNEEARLVA
ncbi:APO protein 1, chloroplastic isoform X2 [Lactuca sativa]|uniref:APO domain-containing protein n=1 Tax=Lactuca sativa TaxID=4236 RepID=A0A9R1XPZ1_LACSA|nr:APO protein 1, chloroplastic isoform X2 [Lactuca sativa]KAJ0215327.1 hypothetical protein LSAT_V11C300119160 [Lactuca sativa]